ncbi:hypothetical protein L917_15272 [Phytophthora nicotianae]|uniref:Uncharacterized protein n=1 Tax=Phytophthora nicotianae TaxID=4792 RepID=W2KJ31_PHYNI|nr:hypothetical protein L917_15272 [Phytophthora nicotianae]ETM38218.1 hypothetical protein L914_15415 [Phytophthora nicotianae]
MVKVQPVQEEIDDIDDCHGCIEDSDEFVPEITEQGKEEGEQLKDSRARATVERLQNHSAVLNWEPLQLTKTRIEICCLFPHNGAFDRVRRRLAVFNSK